MSQALIEKNKGISPVWILPILALCLGGWLLVKSHMDAGIMITLQVDNSKGITVDKTPVMFKGNQIGMVKEIHITHDTKSVDLTIEMKKTLKAYLVEDLKFWIEKVEIEAGRITGLDTLLSGSYIGIQLGTSSTPALKYIALPQKPPIAANAPGLHLSLTADALHSIQIGSGIYHKDVVIGSVQKCILQKDDTVLINVFIKPEYQNLVKHESRFWNASGITVSGGISNLKIHVASIASIFRGGIEMQTPLAIKDSPQAKNGQVFSLYAGFEEAEYGIPLTLELMNGEGIKEGSTEIKYRGMKVGTIKTMAINRSDKYHSVTAQVLLDPRAEVILKENTEFHLVQPEISIKGMRNLDTLLSGSYITFIPGDGAFKNTFLVNTDNPPQQKEKLEPGDMEIMLTSKDLASIDIGSPILYKKITVGTITDFELREKTDDVLLTGVIKKQYAGLLKTTSRFYNMSGIDVNASFTGIKVQSGTLETLVAGGVAFYTPEKGKPAATDLVYPLYQDYAAAENSNPVDPGDQVILLTAQDLGSLNIGSPVLYKKITVGKITNFKLRTKKRDILLTAVIKKQYVDLVKTSSRFYNMSGVEVNASLSGIKIQTGSLETIVAGGVAFYTPGKGQTVAKNQTYRLYDDQDAAENSDRTKITIHFSQTDGLKKGVLIKYNGIKIGEVSKVQYGKDMATLTVDAMLNQKATILLKDTTRFWLVRPEFSLTGTQHLDTLFGGPYIAIEPGKGSSRHEYTALKEEPAVIAERPGLNIILEAGDLFSLKPGDPVYYRRIKVGEVTGVRLSPTFQKVLLNIIIDKAFESIIRQNTKFWNASGIHVSGGIFSGISVSTESLESLMAGGISLATPNNDSMGYSVKEGHHFTLYREVEESWLTWNPNLNPERSKRRIKPQKKKKTTATSTIDTSDE